jgi:tRNA A-37 threonylcarbamoyl transferase component Bud32
MHIHVNTASEHLRDFTERLPELFDREGEVLHAGRNTIKAFEAEGERLVVKRFKRPNLLRAVIYTFFRRSKARRSYEHAVRLRALGVDSPEPVAWSEYRRNGLITETYFVSRRSDYAPLTAATERFPTSDSLPVLEAFARFTVRLHEKGICHEDFNQTNILWRHDEATGRYDFQLIDINRMKFLRRPLRPDECMINLRRLSCPAVAFLYILDRYAETRQWDMDDTLLRGTFFRLLFGRRQQFKKRFRERKLAAAGKKQG